MGSYIRMHQLVAPVSVSTLPCVIGFPCAGICSDKINIKSPKIHAKCFQYNKQSITHYYSGCIKIKGE